MKKQEFVYSAKKHHGPGTWTFIWTLVVNLAERMKSLFVNAKSCGTHFHRKKHISDRSNNSVVRSVFRIECDSTS